MVTKGIYLFWDKKYEQVIYAGRFTGRKRIKQHFNSNKKDEQQVNRYIQSHPERIDSVIFCEFDEISDDDLNQLEKETIKLFKLNRYRYPNSHVFNFTDGGEGMSGYKHPEETRKKISKSKKGIPRNPETIEKISKNHADMSGKNNPMYGRDRSGKNNSRYRHDIPSGKELLNEYESSDVTWDELAIKYKCPVSTIYRRVRHVRGD